MPKGIWKKLTRADEQKIKDEFLQKPVKALAEEIGISGGRVLRFLKKNNLVIPREIIEQRKRDSYFSRGHIPENKGLTWDEYMPKESQKKSLKTTFKKGNKPQNTLVDNAITIRTDHKNRKGRQYKWIRLSESNWEPYHKYLWEKENGQVPDGYCLWFIDGNSLNCNLQNLELITRAENINRNWHDRYPNHLKHTIKTVNKIKKEINKIEKS